MFALENGGFRQCRRLQSFKCRPQLAMVFLLSQRKWTRTYRSYRDSSNGAGVAAATYIGQASGSGSGSGSGSTAGFIGAVTTGALVGFVTPLTEAMLAHGAVTMLGSFTGFYGGFAGGLIESLFSGSAKINPPKPA